MTRDMEKEISVRYDQIVELFLIDIEFLFVESYFALRIFFLVFSIFQLRIRFTLHYVR